MLVLSRNIGEPILIGNDIKLVVLGVQDKEVRIGIKAPEEVPILREELYLLDRQNGEKMKVR